jgi:hypothetical protein
MRATKDRIQQPDRGKALARPYFIAKERLGGGGGQMTGQPVRHVGSGMGS